ncbi:MAG: hypothetical protein M3O29_00365 [Actinomycetota bacterium]|nr:hypothetical protein [Actinomycetota bacterium]
MSKQISEADAKWQAYLAEPKFRHVIRELDGKLERESYVYSTPAGAIELWRTPEAGVANWHQTGHYGGVEVHSPVPLYDGQTLVPGQCEWVRGGKCYTDGSSLAFDEFERDFGSPDYLKPALANWHRSRFNTEAEDDE